MSDDVLSGLFNPRSVAIIGASEKNPWAGLVLGTLDKIGFAGPVHIVNPRGGEVLSKPAKKSARELGVPVDCAYIMVPANALADTIEDLAAAGIRNGVVVTSGFAEIGAEGAAMQDRLFGRARELGLRLVGPNSLGFINYVDRTALCAIQLSLPLLPNPTVAVISQSGATAALIAGVAHDTNIALTHVITVGNEALIDMADAISFAVKSPAVRAIAVFAESIRRVEPFIEAASQALAAKKPIVMLKVGVGALAAQVAKAHTGALVGDERVFASVCRDLGIARVDTIEQLLQTAGLIAHTGVLRDGGFAVASMSGGTCEMIADLGESAGVPFAIFGAETQARLKSVLASYATVQNPLDVTGGVLSNFKSYEDATAIAGCDPAVALVAACFEVPQHPQNVSPLARPLLSHLASGLGRSIAPGFLLGQTYQGTTDFGRELMAEAGLSYVAPGLGTAMNAVAAAFRWSNRVRKGMVQPPTLPEAALDHPEDEWQTLRYLASRGVPVAPVRVVRSAEDVAGAMRELRQPVALKILSPDIAHKTEVGGVTLDVDGVEAAVAEYRVMRERVAQACPDARVLGVTLAPMRTGGVELMVGITRDPCWGPVLAVGLGGIWVELLADVDVSRLPVAIEQVESMLGRLMASRVLDGYRGQAVVNRRRVAEIIVGIANAALALGEDLLAFEVNPLWASGNEAECLDALVVWR